MAQQRERPVYLGGSEVTAKARSGAVTQFSTASRCATAENRMARYRQAKVGPSVVRQRKGKG